MGMFKGEGRPAREAWSTLRCRMLDVFFGDCRVSVRDVLGFRISRIDHDPFLNQTPL